MISEKLLWRVTCPNHASFRLSIVARRGFWGVNEEVDLAPHTVVGLVLQVGDAEHLRHLVSNASVLSSESASRVHVTQL